MEPANQNMSETLVIIWNVKKAEFIYFQVTCFHGKCLAAAKARVTAGFICAPEMCPTEYIITVTISPPQIEDPSLDTLASSEELNAAAPQVTKTSRNVDMTSATTYESNKIHHLKIIHFKEKQFHGKLRRVELLVPF